MDNPIIPSCEIREIPGLDGYYAGRDGTIWSAWARGNRHSSGTRGGSVSGKSEKVHLVKGRAHSRSGHRYFKTRFHKRRLHAVHHAVLEAFGFARPQSLECRHLNGNPSDNRLENLKWGTRLENVHDSIRHGTFRGGNTGGGVVTKEMEQRMIELRSSGMLLHTIASLLGLNYCVVQKRIYFAKKKGLL